MGTRRFGHTCFVPCLSFWTLDLDFCCGSFCLSVGHTVDVQRACAVEEHPGEGGERPPMPAGSSWSPKYVM